MRLIDLGRNAVQFKPTEWTRLSTALFSAALLSMPVSGKAADGRD